jgi:hypothetical protein
MRSQAALSSRLNKVSFGVGYPSTRTVLRVEISSSSSTSNPSAIYLVALLTQGNYAAETGPSISTSRFSLSDRKPQCQRWTVACFYSTNPNATFIRMYTPTGGYTALWSPFLGQNTRNQ